MLMLGCRSAPADDPLADDLLPQTFTATGEQPLPNQWWQHLGDPQLSSLIETALLTSPSLAATWDRLDQAQAIARREGADLRPEVDARAGASADRQRTTTGNNRGERGSQSFSLGLQASYEVDLWGRIESSVDAAKLDAAASQAEVHAAAITLSASIATAWYQLHEARGQTALLSEQIRINEEVLELLELRFRRGLSPLVDVLRQRQLLESRRGQYELALRDEQLFVHQINALVGRPINVPVSTDGTNLLLPADLPATGLPIELVALRPDLQQALYNVQAQDRRLAAALADRYPRLTLSASAGFESEKLRDMLDNWLATIAAELLQPLIDGGQRAAEIDRTAATVSEQINTYRSAILDATRDVEDALVQEASQVRFVESLRRQVELSEQVLERTRDGYRNRGLDYLDVLTALDSNQELARDLLTAQRQRIEFRIALCRALAGPPELPRPEPRTLRASTDHDQTSAPSPDLPPKLPVDQDPPTDE